MNWAITIGWKTGFGTGAFFGSFNAFLCVATIYGKGAAAAFPLRRPFDPAARATAKVRTPDGAASGAAKWCPSSSAAGCFAFVLSARYGGGKLQGPAFPPPHIHTQSRRLGSAAALWRRLRFWDHFERARSHRGGSGRMRTRASNCRLDLIPLCARMGEGAATGVHLLSTDLEDPGHCGENGPAECSPTAGRLFTVMMCVQVKE